jgi:hypothetical protein
MEAAAVVASQDGELGDARLAGLAIDLSIMLGGLDDDFD